MGRLFRLLAQAVLPAVVLAAAWMVTSSLLSGPGNNGHSRPERAETVFAVTAQDVAPGANRASLRAFGTVVAGEIAELRVASPGEVVEKHPDLAVGNIVEAGATLVAIDPFDYEGALREARAQLAEARARRDEATARIAMEESMLARAEEQFSFADRDLGRATALARTGSITEKAVDERRLLVSQRQQATEQRRHTLEAERARRAQQEAAVERLAVAVERAERALEDTRLVAPFTGIVRSETAAVGRLLAANDIAVSLVRAAKLDVRFTLSDQRYGRLLDGGELEGTPVEVTWRIGDTPLRYSATIRRVAADIVSGSGGVDVYARFDQPEDGAVPRPGAFVEVSVPGRLHEPSVRVLTSALHGDHVFVIGKDNRLERRSVRVLALDHGDAIVAGDLKKGDAVVTTRLAEAGDGLLVRRVDLPDAPGVADAEPAEAPPVPPQTSRDRT